jgi:hypothetical protein
MSVQKVIMILITVALDHVQTNCIVHLLIHQHHQDHQLDVNEFLSLSLSLSLSISSHDNPNVTLGPRWLACEWWGSKLWILEYGCP